ncbi:hypothetical protein ACFY2M_43760 [Streptomyces sp. NPDC001276]|uniref:hypothetical protein n=1 Tax=Streptomyces sp. NPDC001276 TaxID=3364555 RepID=UPI00369EBC07
MPASWRISPEVEAATVTPVRPRPLTRVEGHPRHTSVEAEVPESLSAESWREVLEVVAVADRFGLLATSLNGRTLWAVVRKVVPTTGDVGGPSHQR